ncbi:MAG TPA: glucoamylase family protein, partial [Vicinamibacterales bacterium]|nr:glucoamylase family protein [Vicinamibacterales bacterium]
MQVPALERPFRDELLSIERLEERALTAAADFIVDPDPSRKPRNIFSRFHENGEVLRDTYRALADDARHGQFVTAAGEWLLDNYPLVTSEIKQIRQYLPRTFYKKLPTLASGERRGVVRVYAMAVEILRHSDSRIDRHKLTVFINAFQRVAPLTIGELWAWPIMLKLALIENLRRLAVEMLAAREARIEADRYVARLENIAAEDADIPGIPATADLVQILHRMREYGVRMSSLGVAVDAHLTAKQTTTEDVVRAEHQRQATAQVSVANTISSLRFCSVLDWRDYFESVSLVHQILLRDPAGVYGRMDFLSRDRVRQSVEELALPTGEAQMRVALKAIECARAAAAEAPTSRAAHVGHHLIGRGRMDLELGVAYRPKLTQRLRRLIFRHATLVYLGPIVAITTLLLGAAAVFFERSGGTRLALAAMLILLLGSSLDVAVALVQRVLTALIPPRRLPRLDFSGRVPEDARTMVIVPTLLSDTTAVATMMERLEVLALGNLDPSIHFAILSDFTDADVSERPEDAEILAAATAATQSLNQQLGPQHANRFFLFHRHRRWNPHEQLWMGWERKRGKIEEFNRLLRGATDTSFTVQVGDLSILPSIKYCITLDSDTRLPRDAAKSLIGIIAHPLNQPHFDERCGRVTEGYGILQPRVSVTLASAAGSLFARVYAGHTGVDPYTTAVSDLYQDLFSEGIFTGKGLYDVDAFMAALAERVPENALLSHDLFEGLYARTALVSDVEVVDDYPSSVLAHARRQHRWVRGDWQILWWLFPYVPTRSGIERNRLPLISRWKIFDNLRRSLRAPATVALLLLAWTVLPGSAPAWTAIALAPLAFPLLMRTMQILRGPARLQSWRVFARATVDDLRVEAAQVTLELAFLGYHAYEMAHAIGITLIRIMVTRRRLLEWETSAAAAARHRQQVPGVFARQMIASPAIALFGLVVMLLVDPKAWYVAVPILALWVVAPMLAYALSRPVVRHRPTLDADDQQLVAELAQKTWHYFDEHMTAEHHYLPPDNVQMVPDLRVAHRTSPTNIGMALLAMLSAHDLGFITTANLIERIERTLSTVESLERFEGHLLNWYDTRTLAPLAPRYVSTVDSGNFAGVLLVLAVALRKLAAPSGQDSAPPESAALMLDLAGRATALFEGMNFRFLFDQQRRLFSIGYRLADAEGPGRLDPSFYDLLASEARLASFLAIAKGDVTEAHWFHLGRSVTNVSGVPVLLSWSASMFEYLMPLLLMRSYPETLLDASCRMAVQRQIEYARLRRVPWGISESAYNVVDRHDTYQYKAFGVPGLGLKRGLSDELVIAPYATALALPIDPEAGVENLRRLIDEGASGDFGLFDSIDFSHRTEAAHGEEAADNVTDPRRGTVVRTYMAHHQGMALVAMAHALVGDRMVRRFHADPRIQATELLLQERVPRLAPTIEPRPADEMSIVAPAPVMPVRRYKSPHMMYPHAQFLSNGSLVSVVTNGGGGNIQCRGISVTRSRRDPTTDPGGQYIYLRDVRKGTVWSATYQPTAQEPDDFLVEFRAEKATFRRRDDDITTNLEVAVSTEDDVEIRRLTLVNHDARVREIDVTSYAEVVLLPPAADLAHPAFGKLFLETEYLDGGSALICHRRQRDPKEEPVWAVHVLSLEGRPQSPVEWETDRGRFLGRGGDVRRPAALDGRPLSGTTGTVLDPIFSLRQRIRLGPGGSVRLSFATGVARSRESAEALVYKYRDPSAAPRTFALAYTHSQSGLRHLGISADEAMLFERLASRVLYDDQSLRDREAPTLNELGQPQLWPHAISGDLPILLVHVTEDDDLKLVSEVLQAQEYWRLKGLSADLVVLNDHPMSYLDEMQANLTGLLDNGPWRAWKHRPGGAYLLRADTMGKAERTLLQAVARTVLAGDRGDLRAQLAATRPAPRVLPPLLTYSTDQQEAAPPRQIAVPPLTLENGFGGFTDRGRSYTIVLEGDRETPLPWSNVIANQRFGTLVTASGMATTWAGNSRENRLTPFANDPITDRTAEAIFIRDDDTGNVCSPTPGPLARDPNSGRFLVSHSAGHTRFERTVAGLGLTLEVFVDNAEPVKFSLL